jgi:predicted transcriptional regulator
MGTEEEARIAMKALNEKGWTINYGKRSNKNKKMGQQVNQFEPNQLPLPTFPAF